MNNEERVWLNNNLFQFVDKKYGSNGTIDVNSVLSTEDSANFSPLRLNISIINGEYNKKICWLSFYQVNELISCINEIMKENNLKMIYDQNQNADVERKYSNKMFRMLFKKSKDLSDCVLLGIYSSDNDRNIIIMTFDIFRSFFDVLKQFKDNYFLIENMLINRYMTSIKLEELKSINKNLRILPKMFEDFQDNIGNLIINNNNNVLHNDNNVLHDNNNDKYNKDEKYNNETESTMQEFDQFVGDNFENINIPDIENIKEETKKENQETINSIFIDDILKNDINNLYSKTKNIILEDCKIKSFSNLFEEYSYNPLENIDEKSLKSSIYLCELNIRQFLKQYYLYGKEYPKTCQMLRSNINKSSQFNKELAYDLFMIHGYMKYYSNKMESKINDQLVAKIDFYINLRLLTDIFTYTFLINENKDVIKNNIISRYKYFNNNGFFNTFNNELNDYNIEPISLDDIINFIDLVLEKLPNTYEVTKLHDDLYNKHNVKLPSDNKFNIEQIINQIVNLEILTNFNLDIDKESSNFDIDLNKIDKNILQIFKNDKKVNKQKEKQTNLFRYIKYYDNEISDNKKDDFYNHIKEINENNFDFINNNFPLNEIGENIIKGLYQWNLSENKREKYTDFFHKCNETILTKNDIISKETSENDDNSLNEDWGDIL